MELIGKVKKLDPKNKVTQVIMLQERKAKST